MPDDLRHCQRAFPPQETFTPIGEVLVRHAHAHDTKPYMTFVSPKGMTSVLTFGDLELSTGRLSLWLAREHGVRPGMRVAIIPANCRESVIALFALIRSGVEILLIGGGDPPMRQAVLRGMAHPTICLRTPLLSEAEAPNSIPIPADATLEKGVFSNPEVSLSTDLFLIGTSGTTAVPKLVRQMHLNAAANALATVKHHNLGPGDRFLGCLPIGHVNGLHFTLLACLMAGAHATLLQDFNPLQFASVLREAKPRIASVVPSVLDALCAIWRDDVLPEWFDYFVSAAAPLTSETARNVDKVLGARIVQSYGLSETTNFSCIMPTKLARADYEKLMFNNAIPPVGTAVSNDIAIVDSQGKMLPAGATGEVVMRGPNVMRAYFENIEANAESLRSGWFHSGDLGYLSLGPTGEDLLTLTGRLKNIAKVRGEAVSLEELDRRLREVGGIIDAACVSIADSRDGEAIVAVVVAAGAVTNEAIIAYLAQHFSKAVLPRRVVRLAALPRSPTGKIRRSELAALVAQSST